MKSTGVVRRIDDLGRIVIPKEIRRNLKIRDGENMEIFIDLDSIILKKYSKLEDALNIEDWNYISKFKTYIVVDLSSFAEKWGKELVKKTVNIPKWVNTKAETLKINFSKTLEEALLQKIYKE